MFSPLLLLCTTSLSGLSLLLLLLLVPSSLAVGLGLSGLFFRITTLSGPGLVPPLVILTVLPSRVGLGSPKLSLLFLPLPSLTTR